MIPVQFHKGYLWIEVAALGSDKLLHFVVDSGAASSVLNLRTARRLGLELGKAEAVQGVSGPGTAYHVAHFKAQTAGTSLPDSLLALDFRSFGITPGRPVDGLLGADFFRGRIVQIDYAAGKIFLLDKANPDSRYDELPIRTCNECLCVPLKIAGKSQQWMRLDTGCDSALEWFAGDAPAAGATHYVPTNVQIGGTQLIGIETGIHARRLFPGEAGLVGNELLSKFKVTIDGKNNKLFLERKGI